MLSTPEYNEIMQRRDVLQGIIEGAARDKEKYDGMKKAAQANKERAEGRLLLYTNHLSGAIEEYETAHPLGEAEA